MFDIQMHSFSFGMRLDKRPRMRKCQALKGIEHTGLSREPIVEQGPEFRMAKLWATGQDCSEKRGSKYDWNSGPNWIPRREF